jgi:hypothetical protein
MRKLFMTALAVTAIAVTAVPASAQFWAGADRSGVGVQVGPLGAGVGPRFGWNDPYRGDTYRHYRDGYRHYGASNCRIVRERHITPSGRKIIRSKRVCR